MCQKYTLPSSLYNLQNVSTAQFSFYVDLFLSLKIKQLMSKLVISHITVIIDTIPIKLAICFSFFYLWRQEHAWRNEIPFLHLDKQNFKYVLIPNSNIILIYKIMKAVILQSKYKDWFKIFTCLSDNPTLFASSAFLRMVIYRL